MNIYVQFVPEQGGSVDSDCFGILCLYHIAMIKTPNIIKRFLMLPYYFIELLSYPLNCLDIIPITLYR